MKKFILVAAVASMMTGIAHAEDKPKAEVIVNPNVQFLGHTVPMNGSDIFGKINIIPVAADKTKFIANFKGKNIAGPLTFSINLGRCRDSATNKVKYPLTNVVNGKSETVVDVKTATIFEGDVLSYTLKSGDKVVSCGTIQ
jgi:hypothetical protein